MINSIAIREELSEKFRLKLDTVSFPNPYLPYHILLDRTRNIHSYFLLSRYTKGGFQYEESNEPFLDYLIGSLRAQLSEMDRPFFILIQKAASKYDVIEGNEVREFILENGCGNLEKFLLKESIPLSDILPLIRKEL